MWVFREMGTNGIFAPALDPILGERVENFPPSMFPLSLECQPELCSSGLKPDSNPSSTTFSLGDCRQVTSFSRASVSSQMEMGLIIPTSWGYSMQ